MVHFSLESFGGHPLPRALGPGFSVGQVDAFAETLGAVTRETDAFPRVGISTTQCN